MLVMARPKLYPPHILLSNDSSNHFAVGEQTVFIILFTQPFPVFIVMMSIGRCWHFLEDRSGFWTQGFPRMQTRSLPLRYVWFYMNWCQ
jgi:hypothetical protein